MHLGRVIKVIILVLSTTSSPLWAQQEDIELTEEALEDMQSLDSEAQQDIDTNVEIEDLEAEINSQATQDAQPAVEASTATTEAPVDDTAATTNEEVGSSGATTETATSDLEPDPTIPVEDPASTSVSNDFPADVVIEKSVYSNTPQQNCNCEYSYQMPYRERRGGWAFTFALGYSLYEPTYYQPDFVVNSKFSDYYGATEMPLMEAAIGLKKNMPFGALVAEVAGGSYTNSGDFDSELVVRPVRGGITLMLDTLSPEPYIVPYGYVGAYTFLYRESLASQSVQGNTKIGPYYGGGLMFQLNWLDSDTAAIAYDETGLENTYAFVEMRSFADTGDVAELDSDFQLGAGLRLEY